MSKKKPQTSDALIVRSTVGSDIGTGEFSAAYMHTIFVDNKPSKASVIGCHYVSSPGHVTSRSACQRRTATTVQSALD
jgi:hypothetical protein